MGHGPWSGCDRSLLPPGSSSCEVFILRALHPPGGTWCWRDSSGSLHASSPASPAGSLRREGLRSGGIWALKARLGWLLKAESLLCEVKRRVLANSHVSLNLQRFAWGRGREVVAHLSVRLLNNETRADWINGNIFIYLFIYPSIYLFSTCGNIFFLLPRCNDVCVCLFVCLLSIFWTNCRCYMFLWLCS